MSKFNIGDKVRIHTGELVGERGFITSIYHPIYHPSRPFSEVYEVTINTDDGLDMLAYAPHEIEKA